MSFREVFFITGKLTITYDFFYRWYRTNTRENKEGKVLFTVLERHIHWSETISCAAWSFLLGTHVIPISLRLRCLTVYTPGQTDCFKIMNWCWAIFTHCLVITTKFVIAEVKSIYICTRIYCTESEILLGCKVFLFQPRHVHSVNWLIYTDLTEIIVLKTMFTKASCACGICTISPFCDDVIKWTHLPRPWPFHGSPVNSPHRSQWREYFRWSGPEQTVEWAIGAPGTSL